MREMSDMHCMTDRMGSSANTELEIWNSTDEKLLNKTLMFVFFVQIEGSFKSLELGFKSLVKVKKKFRIRNTICSDKHRKLETLLWFEKPELYVLQ